ncbi:MAG TPA: class I SAM-dependent methyltransferase [Candidatus Binataceae bacterium]
MKERFTDQHIDQHDWHSREYVRQWIESDVTRDEERRPVLRQMIALAPFARDAQINVLDVGAGYGVVSEEVLRTFPRAHLTLQDYSELMFEHALKRLAPLSPYTSYVLADLSDPSWAAKLRGPFDLIVSGLAIHNLNLEPLMTRCYRSIRGLLRPDGLFLDYDLFGLVPGGAQSHSNWLREAGFERVKCTWEHAPVGVIAAWVRKED